MTGAREGWRVGARTAMSRLVVGGISTMRNIQVTPRWADNPVQRHVGGGVVGSGGGFPPGRK